MSYRGALLIVSHDRYFLDRLVTSVCEIERGVLRRFKGNYTAFTVQKSAYGEHQLKEYEAQTEEIAKLKDYVARNIVRASTSKMAQSRQKQLEKLEANLIRKPILCEKSAKIVFEYDLLRTPPKELLTVKDIDLKVGSGEKSQTLAESLSLKVRKGERIAIVGANGSGKSTLLKVLQNKSPHTRGQIEWGENTRIAYFEQISALQTSSSGDTVVNAVHKLFPLKTELAIRSLLGGVRLTGDDVYKKVGELSGGERAKLRMAIMTLERGNVLILDEPTNHLDISTRDVLENALGVYKGTIIFVSHDRYLLSKLATRIVELSKDGLTEYRDFAEYIESHGAKQEQPEQSPERNENQSSYKSKTQRAAQSQKRVRVKALELEIEQLESLISGLQKEMEIPEVFANHELLLEKCALFEESKAKLAESTDEWLLMSD
jgi:ATP-binding cassette subfamily F protein 3